MRLIDADYITEGRVRNDPVVIAAKCAPTIDAIPVEWIHKFCEDDISEDDKIAIEWMLGVWQKEQEAQE